MRIAASPTVRLRQIGAHLGDHRRAAVGAVRSGGIAFRLRLFGFFGDRRQDIIRRPLAGTGWLARLSMVIAQPPLVATQLFCQTFGSRVEGGIDSGPQRAR